MAPPSWHLRTAVLAHRVDEPARQVVGERGAREEPVRRGLVHLPQQHRDGSDGGWVCNGKPQTLNITAFQSNAQPPFHKGPAVAVFYLSGSDANGNYFSYSKRVNVSIT